jgi:hypothetical protein
MEKDIYVDNTWTGMPKWKKHATVFTVSVNYNPKRGTLCSIPKPIVEVLDRPERITFLLKGKKIEIVAASEGDAEA